MELDVLLTIEVLAGGRDGPRVFVVDEEDAPDERGVNAEEVGIVVDTVTPNYTSQQCSRCGCTLEENRDGQQFDCCDCSYAVNADYNAAKNVARKLALQVQRGQKSPARGAFCQYALNSGTMIVNATDVASDTPVSVERASTAKPTTLVVGSCQYGRSSRS